MHKKSKDGFTLPELMISMVILAVAFTGIILSFFKCMYLNEMKNNTAVALSAVKDELADIENTTFNLIEGTYDNTTFTANGLTGIGSTQIDSSNPDVLVITLSFSWRQSDGRIIGEDTNLNGQLNGGEDVNGNGTLDSIVKVSTAIYNM